jgi:hypothetical protein
LTCQRLSFRSCLFKGEFIGNIQRLDVREVTTDDGLPYAQYSEVTKVSRPVSSWPLNHGLRDWLTPSETTADRYGLAGGQGWTVAELETYGISRHQPSTRVTRLAGWHDSYLFTH